MMIEYPDRLNQVLEEVARSLDPKSELKTGSLATPEKYEKILSDSGHPAKGHIQERQMSGCAGTLRGRPVSVYFHRGSEMTISARCSAPCRFRIVRHSLGASLNLLQGKRIRSGDQIFDRDFVIRGFGDRSLKMFFQRTDVTSSMHGLLPFFSLDAEPGAITLASDFDEDEIRPDRITARLEALVDLADALDEAFADRIHEQDGDGTASPEKEGGEL
jgi:hypothetical protein